MIPVVIKHDDDSPGEPRLLHPDTKVGVVNVPFEVEIRPWCHKRMPFKGPVWYEATWTKTWPVSRHVERGGHTYYWSFKGHWYFVPKVRGEKRRLLSKQDMAKLKLPEEPPEEIRTHRVRFALQKLYGVRPGAIIVFEEDGQWLIAIVKEYELWRDKWRVERNQTSKKNSTHRKYLRRATWLDRVLED
jgi:hypothetical protein